MRRFRPIVLTAAAAVLAMIPLSRSVFWGPMAVAIMGGLIVATALTLLALPAMYAAWFRVASRRPAAQPARPRTARVRRDEPPAQRALRRRRAGGTVAPGSRRARGWRNW